MGLTTLDKLKEYIGDVGSLQDVFLQRCLDRADDAIKRYCSRDFVSTQYTELYDGTGTDTLLLNQSPVLVNPLPVVLEYGKALTVGTDPSVAGVDVIVYGDRGLLVRAHGHFWPGRAWYKVTYTAGFAPVPEIVQQAALDMAALFIRERDRLGLSSKIIGQQQVQFRRTIPDEVRRGLDFYREIRGGLP